MPKQKTHKGLTKRFRVSAGGKVKHRKAGRGHLLSGKRAKRRRQLRKPGILTGVEAYRVLTALGR